MSTEWMFHTLSLLWAPIKDNFPFDVKPQADFLSGKEMCLQVGRPLSMAGVRVVLGLGAFTNGCSHCRTCCKGVRAGAAVGPTGTRKDPVGIPLISSASLFSGERPVAQAMMVSQN